MKIDRANFITRLDAIRTACDEPLLVNTADTQHNERAKQLRCGLCVMTFSALEEFIKTRLADALSTILPAAIPFANLPEKMRAAATLGALQGLLFQQRYAPDDQKFTMLSSEVKTIATVNDQNYRISKFSFAHSSSNVQLDEITSLLECLNIEKPWETTYFIAKRLKLATPNPTKSEFKTLSSDRHSAAHKQSFDIPTIDLKTRIDSALSIGIALDVVITAAVRNLNTCIARHGMLKELKQNAIQIFFVSTKSQSGRFRLEQEGRVKAVCTNAALQSVKALALSKLTSEGVFVLHDGSYRPKEWYCEM